MIRQLLTGKPALAGTFCTLASIEALEVLCHCGVDFVIVDGQHGGFSIGEMKNALRAAQAAGVYAIGRLPAHGQAWIEPLLDAGYNTLLAPMVNSAAEAAELADAAYYPPLGVRSQSSCRAMLRDDHYRENFNRDFELLVMIEHAEAIKNLDSILDVEGVSGCFFGATDLSSSYGAELPTGFEAVSQAVEAARAQVVSAAKARGKLVGIAAGGSPQAVTYRGEGFEFVTLSSDRNLLKSAIMAGLGEWKL